MTLSRYTTYIGIAADRVNAQITSAVSTGGTSLPITNINYVTTNPLVASGANYSAIIIDGPLTETVALSGNLSAGAVPIAALANNHSAFVYVVFQLTASIGPTAYIPAETFKPSDVIDQLYDKAAVGSLVDNRGAVQGVRTSTFDFGGAFFADIMGYPLGGIFGAEDYTNGTPDTHAFSVLNTTLSGSTLSVGQPVRYLLYNYDAYNTRIFSGRFTDLGFTFDPKQLLKYEAKFLARTSGVVANPTAAFTALTPLPSWTGIATIGGVVVGKVLTANVDIARSEAEAIPTLSGIQDPWDVFVGATSVKGKYSLIFDDDTQLLAYQNATQPIVILTFTRGTTAGLTVHMNKCNYDKADVIQQGKAYVTNDIEFEGIANSTDATTAGGGISPAKITLANAVASGTTYT